MAVKKWQKPEPKKDAVWQVVQEKIGSGGTVIARQNFGIPTTLESAKKIVEYKNTTDLRSYLRYRLERIEDNERS